MRSRPCRSSISPRRPAPDAVTLRARRPCRSQRRPGAAASPSARANPAGHATMPCIVSGSGSSSRQPRSSQICANCSAYSGLPPACASSACWSRPSTGRSSSEPISRAVSSSDSGSQRQGRAHSACRRPSPAAARAARAGPCRRRAAARRSPSRPASRRSRAARRRPSAGPRTRARAAAARPAPRRNRRQAANASSRRSPPSASRSPSRPAGAGAPHPVASARRHDVRVISPAASPRPRPRCRARGSLPAP